ncbi:MAG: efflux RND transporter periplasmic adaptor subunit [Chitinophagaceae bacterium]
MIRHSLNILLFLFFFISCKSKQEKIKPVEEKITESVYASGIIKSNNQYKVFSTVNGVIAAIMVKEGDVVKKGDAIIKLVNTNAQLNNENAALSSDYAATSANTERLNELQIATNLAKSKMTEDALLQQRQQNLWNENIGTKNELEQRQLAYKTSVTAYQAAELRYTQLQKQINFQAKQSQNNLQISSSIKNDYTIKTNADGKVYNIILKQGEMVNTLSPVAIIGDANNFMMELQVEEFDINRIKTGQKIMLSMDSYKGQVFEAVVTKINPTMNERSKSFTIEALFIKQPATLYPNLTCEANILIQQKEKAITIPRNYLLAGDSVLIESKKKRKVIVGLKDYQKVEIISGITVNDFIYKPAL